MSDGSEGTLMKDLSQFSEYRLSSHFGMFGTSGFDHRLSHFLSDDEQGHRTSFVMRNLSSHVRLVQSRRDMASCYWACIRTKKPLHYFCTGSRYLGEWNALGFAGEGMYRYPHGVIYEGEFNKNGMFHGLGTLTYPNGQKLQGIWKNGQLEDDYTYIFASNEMLDENFKYCHQPDRRFHIEIQKDFGPVGQEYLTADQPVKELQDGCYDVGVGTYNPKLRSILSYPKSKVAAPTSKHKPVTFDIDEERNKQWHEISTPTTNDLSLSYSGKEDNQFRTTDGRTVIEIPTEKKIKWIEKNCRKSRDEPTGYRPDLYEKWMVGSREDKFLYVHSSQRTILEELDEQTPLPKTQKPSRIYNYEYRNNPNFMSFIQKRNSLVDARNRKRPSSQKPENRKKTEEKRTFLHNKIYA